MRAESLEDTEIAIIGAGAAGVSAAIYAQRGGAQTIVFEKSSPGGQIATAEHVENYAGTSGPIAGHELATNMLEQLLDAGADLRMGVEVEALSAVNGHWELATPDGAVRARAVIICVGSTRQSLGIPGEEQFFGHGVSDCATCDGPLLKGLPVAVVGSGDSACDEALTLSTFASDVHLLIRGEGLGAAAVLQERVNETPNIHVHTRSVVKEIRGDTVVQEIAIADAGSGKDETIPVSGVFIFIGLTPNIGPIRDVVTTDERGHITVDHDLSAGQPGLYAAGDIRRYSSRQLVSAAGDGATAALNALAYLRNGQANERQSLS